MSAIEALNIARAAGVSVGLEGDDLILQASEPPPVAVLDALSHYKSAIVAFLREAPAATLNNARASRQHNHDTVTGHSNARSWANWKAAELNRLFRTRGATGQLGQIDAATVRHGEPLGDGVDSAPKPERPMSRPEAQSD